VKNIVVLTGAGISAESGLQTFRASDGLWCDHHVEDVATPEAFLRNPALVQQFYNQRRAQLADVTPNPAHDALAQLAKNWPGQVTLITQNVDDLHDRALRDLGVEATLIHMHGELLKMQCTQTSRIFDCPSDIAEEMRCGCCDDVGTLRPHIVWFGEMPLRMEECYESLRDCDLFLSIGTSGNVYPAAGFVFEAKRCGARAVELNLEPTGQASLFDACIEGPASRTVPKLVGQLLRGEAFANLG